MYRSTSSPDTFDALETPSPNLNYHLALLRIESFPPYDDDTSNEVTYHPEPTTEPIDTIDPSLLTVSADLPPPDTGSITEDLSSAFILDLDDTFEVKSSGNPDFQATHTEQLNVNTSYKAGKQRVRFEDEAILSSMAESPEVQALSHKVYRPKYLPMSTDGVDEDDHPISADLDTKRSPPGKRRRIVPYPDQSSKPIASTSDSGPRITATASYEVRTSRRLY